jgi:hypothetical protein
MASFTSVPKDLNKIKSKVALNRTKRQLICFGTAAVIGIPTYLLTRGAIGNTAAVLLMMGIMAPLFLLAMYERDGLPAEKLIRNYIRTKFYWAGIRPYKAKNFYENILEKDEVITFEQNREGTAKTAKPQHSSGKSQSGRKPKRPKKQ